MPPKSKQKSSLGRAMINDRLKAKKSQGNHRAHVTDFVQSENTISGKLKSVIERNALDDYLVTGLATHEDFSVLRQHQLTNIGINRIVKGSARFNTDRSGRSYNVDVPIPRRPILFVGPNASKEEINAEKLDETEKNAFLQWRKAVASLEEEKDFVLTPFERNLEFWRQLWRVIEKADVVAQVLDARNPLFFRCRDLERYVGEVDPVKKSVVIINKSDFLTRQERESWVRYFQKQNVDVLFFSAIRELHRLGQFVPAEGDNTATRENQIGFGNLDFEQQQGDMADVLDCSQLLAKLIETSGKSVPTLGMVGFPNVGKSSLINALCGEKKVSVSRQPGKTKHFQTLPMDECILCDCPGLVFPSVVAARSHLVINGVMPIDHYKGDICEPAQLICDRATISLPHHFGVEPAHTSWLARPSHANPGGILDARGFLTDVAMKRKYIAAGRGGVADLFRTTKMLLKDYCSGKLLHCEAPPLEDNDKNIVIPVDQVRKEFVGRFLPGGMPMQPGDDLPLPDHVLMGPSNHGGVIKLPDYVAQDGGSDFGSYGGRRVRRSDLDEDEDGSSESESSSEDELLPVVGGPTRNVGGGDLFSNLMNRVHTVEEQLKREEEIEKVRRHAQRREDGLPSESEESD